MIQGKRDESYDESCILSQSQDLLAEARQSHQLPPSTLNDTIESMIEDRRINEESFDQSFIHEKSLGQESISQESFDRKMEDTSSVVSVESSSEPQPALTSGELSETERMETERMETKGMETQHGGESTDNNTLECTILSESDSQFKTTVLSSIESPMVSYASLSEDLIELMDVDGNGMVDEGKEYKLEMSIQSCGGMTLLDLLDECSDEVVRVMEEGMKFDENENGVLTVESCSEENVVMCK